MKLFLPVTSAVHCLLKKDISCNVLGVPIRFEIFLLTNSKSINNDG